jgi:hypothetical protein
LGLVAGSEGGSKKGAAWGCTLFVFVGGEIVWKRKGGTADWRLGCLVFLRGLDADASSVKCAGLGLGLAIEVGGDRGCGAFAEGAIRGAEGGEEVRVDVEFADDFTALKNGDDDF